MPTMALGAFLHAIRMAMELRIDVNHSPREVEKELEAIHARMKRRGDRLYGLPEVGTGVPGLVLRYREADGEYYVYVVDAARGRLAGYTVFNRLVEVGRRADPYVRAPHSKYAAPCRGRGGRLRRQPRWARRALIPIPPALVREPVLPFRPRMRPFSHSRNRFRDNR